VNYEQTKEGILVPKSSSRPEMREVATTRDGRDITRGYVDPFMLQQPTDSVLQLRGGGDYKIYKEVLRDDQVASCFAQRRLAVIAKELQVDAGGTSRADKKAADFMSEQIKAMAFDNATDKMLFGVYYGYAAAEIMWGRDGANIIVDKLKVRDRVRFGFDGFGNLRLKTFSNPEGELLPDRKFWSFCTGADHDDEPYGLGLAHWLYWPVFFKRAGIQYWMIFLERFGQPTTVGKHPTNATNEERRKLLDALEAIATDTGITIPQGMEIEFLEAARSGTADYVKLCEYMDAAIAKIILGQTASTQGTPGRLGDDDLQGDVRADLIRADADLVCESFNETVVTWLTEYNFPGAKPPHVYRVTDPDEDLAARADRDTKIYQMGFKPTLEYIHEQYGEGWEKQNNTTPPGGDGKQPPPNATDAPETTEQPLDTSMLESPQQTALNGAQIKSLSDVIALVQQGQLDRARAYALIEVGFPAISKEQIERLLGDVVTEPKPVPEPLPGKAEFADPDTERATTLTDQADDKLQSVTDVWINRIRDLVMNAESLEAIRDGLAELLPDMSIAEYSAVMADVLRLAELNGRSDIMDEVSRGN
jgi:phage gp29-like protein